MDALFDIANRHSLQLVEDAAHALPTTWNGMLVGRLPTAACVFSFYANKTITTGEGGMVVTRDTRLANRMRIMRLHGMSRDAFDRYRSTLPSWNYEIVAPGFKYNLTDIAAALGLVQLRRLPAFLDRRQLLATRYMHGLAGLPLILPAQPESGDIHAWHLFVVRLSSACVKARDEIVASLSRHGIGTSVHYVPLHRHPYWRDRYRLRPEQFPEAEMAFSRMISLPLYTAMGDEDQERVIDVMHEILG
jgi:dTDP-4-amino-4,6-dideoxygalactose transaminase